MSEAKVVEEARRGDGRMQPVNVLKFAIGLIAQWADMNGDCLDLR